METSEVVQNEDSPLADEEANDELRADEQPLSARVGALLFVSPRPLTTETLAELTRSDEEEVEAAIETLKAELREAVHGFSIYEVAGAWQMRTGADNARVVQRLIPPRARRLSRAAAETLAVIAYKQPVQRAEIEAIRGVDALPTLRTLLDARLIRIVGREATPGQPALYGTTSVFLEKFGLKDLSDLPTIRELVELAEEPGETPSLEGQNPEIDSPDFDSPEADAQESEASEAELE